MDLILFSTTNTRGIALKFKTGKSSVVPNKLHTCFPVYTKWCTKHTVYNVTWFINIVHVSWITGVLVSP